MGRLAACLLLVLGLSTRSAAQGPFASSPYQPPTDDRTGTNPLNLQHQVDVSNSFLELDTWYLNASTYRHAVPLFNRRMRVAGVLPIGFSNLTGRTGGGIGDVGADIEWTPWLSARSGLVAGVRTTWNTSTSDVLGYGGKHTLMPYAQFVTQLTPRVLLVPFGGYRASIGGEDFAPSYKDMLVGATLVWRARERAWIATTPQVVFDLEHELTYGDVGGEVGYMVLDRVGLYVRPSVGFGRSGAKPYDWGVAFGFRFVP